MKIKLVYDIEPVKKSVFSKEVQNDFNGFINADSIIIGNEQIILQHKWMHERLIVSLKNEDFVNLHTYIIHIEELTWIVWCINAVGICVHLFLNTLKSVSIFCIFRSRSWEWSESFEPDSPMRNRHQPRKLIQSINPFSN